MDAVSFHTLNSDHSWRKSELTGVLFFLSLNATLNARYSICASSQTELCMEFALLNSSLLN